MSDAGRPALAVGTAAPAPPAVPGHGPSPKPATVSRTSTLGYDESRLGEVRVWAAIVDFADLFAMAGAYAVRRGRDRVRAAMSASDLPTVRKTVRSSFRWESFAFGAVAGMVIAAMILRLPAPDSWRAATAQSKPVPQRALAAAVTTPVSATPATPVAAAPATLETAAIPKQTVPARGTKAPQAPAAARVENKTRTINEIKAVSDTKAANETKAVDQALAVTVPVAAPAVKVPVSQAAVAGHRGKLVVSSRPSGASVFINNEFVGRTPLEMRSLPIGSRAVRLTLDGYDTWSRGINVVANRSTAVDASLSRNPSLSN